MVMNVRSFVEDSSLTPGYLKGSPYCNTFWVTLCWHLHELIVSSFVMRCYGCLSVHNLIDPSFQTLHAIHSMERLLNEMVWRSAVFDVVFWEGKPKVHCPKGYPGLPISFQILATSL
jgi:hypothetical protein